MNILDILPKGLENAISTAEISSIMNADERTVRANIARYRNNGAVICSNGDKSIGPCGYFLPTNRAEIETFVRVEKAKIKSHKAALKSAEKELKK
jgi:hypothetical protein